MGFGPFFGIKENFFLFHQIFSEKYCKLYLFLMKKKKKILPECAEVWGKGLWPFWAIFVTAVVPSHVGIFMRFFVDVLRVP